jgi:RNA polymerase sigma-70 factor (ECF subfamily)
VTKESELIRRAQQGDSEALGEIVEQHQQTIYNVALRMCGNPHDAEETMQETFLSAIQALPRFQGRSKLSTWLYRIASNQCLMRRRRDAAAPVEFFMDDSDDDPAETMPKYFVDWSYDPDSLLLDAELQQVMEEAIENLPPKLRIVFIWRELEGLSTAETAEVLNISESAVKVRLHRARLQLRDQLSRYFADRAEDHTREHMDGGDRHA